MVDEVLPIDDAPVSVPKVVKEIAIHHCNVLKDMILAFKAFLLLMIEGILKMVEEAFSLFWREFYNSLAMAASEKVPAIQHDYQKAEWQRASCILVIGFSLLGCFPIELSKP